MTISAPALVELLFNSVNGCERAGQKIAEAYSTKNLIWLQHEWMYVKDIEAALRAMKKLHDKGDFAQFSGIKEIILGTVPFDETNDSWLKSRVLDCKSNLDALYAQP